MAGVRARDASRLERLAKEQAALRRVATLVAQGAPAETLFAVVAGQVAEVLRVPLVSIVRYEPDGTASERASHSPDGAMFVVGTHWSLEGTNVVAQVRDSARPARIDDYDGLTGEIAETVRRAGIRSTVGNPIVVAGRMWGAMVVSSFEPDVLPADTEARLSDFTELIATAIANGEAREEVQRLADEQSALRRVATLVARAASQAEVFSAIAAELGRLMGVDHVRMWRFEADDTATTVASAGAFDSAMPVGLREPLHDDSLAGRVHRSGRSQRIDDYGRLGGRIAERAVEIGVGSAVATPIIVERRLWGAMVAASRRPGRLPADVEGRMAQFTELMASAIANTESRARADRLALEQAALRRVATLVAKEAPLEDVFAKVSEVVVDVLGAVECGLLRDEGDGTASIVALSDASAAQIGTRLSLDDPSVTALVLREGRIARIDDYAAAVGEVADGAQERGIRSSVGCPIVVGERTWGVMAVATQHGAALPAEAEARIGQFSELVATAIANSEARAEVERLAEEQSALRRVATLVAEGVEPAALFSAVTREVARLFADVSASLVPSVIRFDPGPEFVLVGAARPMLDLPLDSRWGPKDLYVSTRVQRTGRSARVEEADVAALGGPDAELLRRQGFLHQVGSPIVVEDRPWGAMTINSAEPLPPDAGDRLEKFTELVATAIANAESREGLRRLADEQASLRRVATLVARGHGPDPVFRAVVDAAEARFGADVAAIVRFDADGRVSVMGAHGPPHAPGARVELDPRYVVAAVRRTGQAARFDTDDPADASLPDFVRELGIRSGLASPIIVDGALWGAITVASLERALPAGTARRLADFTELMATAVSNAQAREDLQRLVEEQAALRRVATLVAGGASPTAVFDAVAAEVDALMGADGVTVSRYEPAGEVTVVAHRGPNATRVPPGTRVKHEGENVTTMVRRLERPARMEHYEGTRGVIAELVDELGVRSSVGAPIVVDGRLWGVVIANWRGDDPPAVDTEERMAQFAELLDTAIANADTRDQLTASRARLLTAADDARRRVVRDLHDGAQQRLVHTIVTLKLARDALDERGEEAAPLVREALDHAQQSNAELRELAHGIIPPVLTRGGLRAAVDTVVERVALPVDVDVPAERFPAEIEASAYFIVAEALTNVVKHARAARAEVEAFVDDAILHVEVRDDGIGGADPAGGGLVGISDRATALGGRLTVEERTGGGTVVAAALPLRRDQEPKSAV